jgi:hypothetical protein
MVLIRDNYCELIGCLSLKTLESLITLLTQIRSSLPELFISLLTEEDLCLLFQNASISLCIVSRLFIKLDA